MTAGGRFYPWYVVFVMLLVNALSYLDRQVMSILISPIQADLGFSDTQMGIVIGPAFMALYLLAGLPMGHFADRYDRSLLLFGAILIWSGGTLLTALAGGFGVLSLARALVGLGEAAVVPAAYSLVADYFAPDRRARATSWVTIGIAIGAGSALFVGGLLLRLFDGLSGRVWPVVGARPAWAMVLVAFAAVGVLVALVILTVRDPRSGTRAAGRPGPPAAAGFVGFLRRERRGMATVMGPYILLNYMQVAMIVWVPTLLTRRLAMTPAEAATLYGVITMAVPIVAALSGGWLADRLSARHAAGPFLLVTWLTPLFLPGVLLFALSQSLPVVVAGLVVVAVVGGVCSTTVYTAVQSVAPVALRGRVLALYGLLGQVAGIGFGPLLVGLVSDHVLGDKAMLHLAITIAIVPAWIVAVVLGFAGRWHFADLRGRVAG